MKFGFNKVFCLSAISCAVISANVMAQSTLTSVRSLDTFSSYKTVLAESTNTQNLKLSTESISNIEQGKVVDQKVKTINGEEFTFTKLVDEAGNISAKIVDKNGREISEKSIPRAKFELVHPEVSAWIKKMRDAGNQTTRLAVDLAIDLSLSETESIEVGEAQVLDGQTVGGTINNKKMQQKEMNAYADALAEREHKVRNAQHAQVIEQLESWLGSHKLLDAPGVKQALAEGGQGASLALTAPQLVRLIESRDELLQGIEPTGRSEDDINSAMADTNITNFALPYSSTRGDDIGIYMTESGCANESRITNYDRLAGSETNHSRNVGAIIRAVSPDSFLYCRGGAVLPQNSDLDGVGGNPSIYVVTRSNSTNDNTNYTTLDRNWDNFAYNKKISVFNSGGNTGNDSGNVRSPGKGLNITTVANYNDSNDTVASNSPFNDPKTGNDKPELAAPGVNITAGGFTMSGTSMSTPHAAAFTADMMSHSTYLKNRPHLAKAKLLAGATDSITGGYNKVGLGGIDFKSAQWSGYWSWWQGGNGSWNYFDNLDNSSDGYVTRKVYISSSWNKVRVALAWMNRGTYTYNNRNDAHPIGMDLDLRVYDPNGNYVGGSFSWDNPFEKVNFTPNMSGYYTFKVNRYANRDTNSAVRMGMYVNYYN